MRITAMSTERLALAMVAAALLAACASSGALAPIEPPARSAFALQRVALGARLAAIGNCAGCHTAEGGKPYAGGRALATPFGTMYGTNITPDLQTGIGRWSEAAFRRAMHEGLDRDGRHLYPAFPYDHFTKVSDADVGALYAYLMTRQPVRQENRRHELSFPFNVRSLVGVWKALYFAPGRFTPDAARSAQWNRGAYLVQGLAHCGSCHTPRSALGAEDAKRVFEGGEAEGWHGPALNADSPSPVPWTAATLHVYLRTGLEERHAIAAGPMQPVVRDLASVADQDVAAIAAYIADQMGGPAPRPRERADAAPMAQSEGALIYAGACAACHDQGRQAGSSGNALQLALSSAPSLPSSKNLLRITLEGVPPPEGDPGRMMPAFGPALTDAQVVALAAYIRTRFGRAPPWQDIDEELAKARQAR